jgi:hypothetical protein
MVKQGGGQEVFLSSKFQAPTSRETSTPKLQRSFARVKFLELGI